MGKGNSRQDRDVAATSKNGVRARFVVVGIWNSVFSYLLFLVINSLLSNIFDKRYIVYMTAILVGRTIAITNAFIFHKYFTFRSKAKGVNLIKEFVKFYMTYNINLLVSITLMPVTVELVGIPPAGAAAIVMMICAAGSYLIHSRFTFKNRVLSREVVDTMSSNKV
jgi:putative flippase GtrA